MSSNESRMLARKQGAIGQLIFNHPEKHNAVSLAMAQMVPDILLDFEKDPEIRVIVVSGAGHRAFIAGSNITAFDEIRADPAQNRQYQEISQSSYDALYRCEKPTIAMIRGYCLGGGIDYAASCDIRICSSDAIFGIPAVKLGLGYGYQGQIRVNRLIGSSRARELYFTGRRYTADEALSLGLVHEVVAPDQLTEHVRHYADAIAQNAPLTLKALKQVFLELEDDSSVRDMPPRIHDLIAACYDSDDYREGKAAFSERRAPHFKGC